MDAISLIGAFSILGGTLALGIACAGASLGEGNAAASAFQAMAQQPDEANRIRSTLFVSMAMIETGCLYTLLIAFILLYANPLWNHVIGM